jgi:uncharacterized protein YqeY
MSLKDTIFGQLAQAIKKKDALRLNTLRLLKAAIKNKEVELRRNLEDEDVLRLVKTQVKQRKEAMRQFHDGGREDLVAKEGAELTVLSEFLPKQLSVEAVNDLVERMVKELGAKDMTDMGRVMKAVMEKVAGTADGKMVSESVKKHLGG